MKRVVSYFTVIYLHDEIKWCAIKHSHYLLLYMSIVSKFLHAVSPQLAKIMKILHINLEVESIIFLSNSKLAIFTVSNSDTQAYTNFI
jgi:hypothetical protein